MSDRRLSRTDAPRSDGEREWEVFVRETTAEPLRHAGSVSAPTAATAREVAEPLFEHAAAALWLCPADEVVRYAERTLGEDA
jgi:rSAM-partnered protein